MDRFRIQIIFEVDTWNTGFNIPKNDRCSDSSTDWTLVSLNSTIKNYGRKLIYDQVDSLLCDIYFSIITITHSVYKMDHISYLKDLLKSVPTFRKIVKQVFPIKNDWNLLTDCGFWKTDNIRLYKEFENNLLEQNEDYLYYY